MDDFKEFERAPWFEKGLLIAAFCALSVAASAVMDGLHGYQLTQPVLPQPVLPETTAPRL